MYDNTDDCDVLKSAAVQRKKLSDANEQLRAAQKQLKESSARILALEEAVLVLAECVNFAVGPMCRVGLVGVVDHVDRKLESNPTARAAVEKARST